MAEYARIVNVTRRTMGTNLSSDHTLGVSTLTVDSTLGLEEPPEDESLTYTVGTEEIKVTSFSEDETTIFLGSPTTEAHSEGERIAPNPVPIARVAWCRLDDDEEEGELVDAIVPHALYDRIPLGMRTIGESVELEDSYDDWTVSDVIGSEPEVDPSFLQVDELSALSADLGTVTAGTVTGIIIEASRFRTNSSGSRITIADPGAGEGNDRIKLFGTGGVVGNMRPDAGDVFLEGTSSEVWMRLDNSANVIRVGRLRVTNGFMVSDTGGDNPPAGFVAFRKVAGQNNAEAVFPDGTRKQMT